MARDASHIEVQNYGMACQPSQSRQRPCMVSRKPFKNLFFKKLSSTIPSRRNKRFSAENPFRKSAKISENTKQDFPLLSCLAMMTFGWVHAFCPLWRVE